MVFFNEEKGGPYFDKNNAYIPYDEEDNYYKNGMMNDSSKEDYEMNKKTVQQATKRLVDILKAHNNSPGGFKF